ncbi:hypothetical protein DM01DRAFT_1182139 [Hesseltinella vesiculosa]|uniref:CLASP N-terminal domain-containing protein n=1 Tax=Hesseltinella vesiculosa TaxID=101127 RepID=A0A1X2G454_9FUNG|nr:hypothetical protein DM01DRAFT_1182139 [Hesseltinella vesiculosa]
MNRSSVGTPGQNVCHETNLFLPHCLMDKSMDFTSSKELDALLSNIAISFKDKEDEHNWENRQRHIVQMRRLINGNAPEKYADVLIAGIRQNIDGIVKSAESLRTTLALDSLQLIADIGKFCPKNLDNYLYEQCLQCLIKAASMAKKIVALQSKDAMISFLQHASYYSRTPQILWMAVNEKNNQVRHFTVLYVLALLQFQAPKESVRSNMDRHGGTELIGKLLQKSLIDAAPVVRQASRCPFWLFWYFWRGRGENLLHSLAPAIRKPLESSKSAAMDLLAFHHSPDESNTAISTISAPSEDKLVGRGSVPASVQNRTMSPTIARGNSPLAVRSALPPVAAGHSTRKSRVPGLTRKKSMASIRRKQTIMTMLQHDDLTVKVEGLQTLARKLTPYDTSDHPFDISSIHVDDTVGTATDQSQLVDGIVLQPIIASMVSAMDTNIVLYEQLSTWEITLGVLVKLAPFDAYLQKVMLDAASAPSSDKKSDDWIKYKCASRTLARIKWFLSRTDEDLVERIYHGMLHSLSVTRLKPMERRKLSAQWLMWMDQHVVSTIGLEYNSEDDPWLMDNDNVQQDLGHQYWMHLYKEPKAGTSAWFESDINVRRCLDLLVPVLQRSAPGSLSHEPLVTLVGHLRLVNQKLFDAFVSSLGDDVIVSKICTVLGIHIKAVQPLIARHDILKVSDLPQTSQYEAEPSLFEQDTIIEESDNSAAPRNYIIETGHDDSLQKSNVLEAHDFGTISHDQILFGSSSSHSAMEHQFSAELVSVKQYTNHGSSNETISCPRFENSDLDVNLDGPSSSHDVIESPPKYQLTNSSPLTPAPEHSNLYEDIPTLPSYFTGNISMGVLPLPVFDRNVRSDKGGRVTAFYQALDKWADAKASEYHQKVHVPTVKKFMCFSKEAPVQKKWDQGGDDEPPGSVLWESGQKDGGNFVELMQCILDQFDHCEPCWQSLLELSQQLVTEQSGLLRFYERRVNDKGKTLESQLIEQVLSKRASEDSTICAAADDLMDSLLLVIEPQTSFDVLLAYLGHCLLSSSYSKPASTLRYEPASSAFLYLGKAVHLMNDTVLVEEWMTKGGAAVFVRGLNHEDIQIRKYGVMAIVEFQEVLGDGIYLFLGDLRQDQINLIRHYVHKSVKKKSSLRQLSANGHLQ